MGLKKSKLFMENLEKTKADTNLYKKERNFWIQKSIHEFLDDAYANGGGIGRHHDDVDEKWDESIFVNELLTEIDEKDEEDIINCKLMDRPAWRHQERR